MRLLPRFLRHEQPADTKCPRCGTPAPADSLECSACGWDFRDAYHDPLADEPAKADQ